MRKILVIGGIHGNELLGVRVAELLKAQPIINVDTIIANPRAVERGVRFTQSDLNRSFGTQKVVTYEVERARKLQKLAAGYDIVLDFHNTQTPDNNCSFVGDNCDKTLYDATKTLGFSACIEATYDCINKYCPNVVSIEVSIGDRLDDPIVWYQKIIDLTERRSIGSRRELTLYRFARRVTWGEKEQYGISDWRPFRPLPPKDKESLGLVGDYAPIFIGSRLTEFYATLLTRERKV